MKIEAVQTLAKKVLIKLGFVDHEVKLIARNLIEAELVEKKTHGLIRLSSIAKLVSEGKISLTGKPLVLLSETKSSLHFDGQGRAGFVALYQSLEQALVKVKSTGILAVALKDLAYASGYIGDYARLATEQNLIFIGFHNSSGGLIPYGTTQNLWGTNPITIGVPTHGAPVILDMASSKTTWGNLLVSKNELQALPKGVALDQTGRSTTDPAAALLGGLLPIAGHKGSGLSLIVELLAGGLSNSRVGKAVKGGWGSFYLLLDPTIFRSLEDFKDDIQKALTELKSAPKAQGVEEIFFPGEQAYLKRQKNLAKGEIEVSKQLLEELEQLLK